MYESYFGLRACPFQLTPDPDYFFASRGHRRALAYLRYGVHRAEGFIVITGEVGAGKSMLVRGLLRELAQEPIAAAQVVTTQLDPDALIRYVADCFGLPAQGGDKASLLSSLSAHFNALHAAGRRPLLIVDEAQNLAHGALEELRMLSNFQSGNRPLLQTFLVGQPELRRLMQAPDLGQLLQRVVASCHLGALEPDETRGYIEHRLRHAGWAERPRFTVAAFARIHAVTEGVPRRINTLCDRLLLACFLAQGSLVDESDVLLVARELSEELGPIALPLPPSALAPLPRHDAVEPESARVAAPLTAATGTPPAPATPITPAGVAAATPVAWPVRLWRALRGRSNHPSSGHAAP